MEHEKLVKRINELSRKSKNEGLNELEKEEQQKLRRIYIDAFKGNMKSTLDSLVIVDKDGNKRSLKQ